MCGKGEMHSGAVGMMPTCMAQGGVGSGAPTGRGLPCRGSIERRGGVRWQIVAFFAGLGLLTVALALRPSLRSHAVRRTESLLRAANAALEAGDPWRAHELADKGLATARRTPALVGPSFLAVGLAEQACAERAESAERLDHLARAAEYFAEAAKAGVPRSDRPKLLFHRARCLFDTARVSESIPLLERSLELFPEGRAEVLELLTAAYLDPDRLDLERALRLNSDLIRTADLSTERTERAWKTRGEILHRLGRLNFLAGVPVSPLRTDPRCVGQLVRAQECYENKQYGEAIELYQDVLAGPGLPVRVQQRVRYLMGVAARDQGDSDAALAAWQQVEWHYPNTEEARAAAALSGELLMKEEKCDAAIRAFARAACQAITDGEKKPRILSTAALRQLMAATMDRLRQRGAYDQALELLTSYRMVASGAAADRSAAQLNEDCARMKLREAEPLAQQDAETVRYQAEELFKTAGVLLVRVADEQPERAQEVLWQAAQDLMQGKAFLPAFDAARRVLDAGVAGTPRAEALALAATALESCGRHDAVPEFAQACIAEFPDEPAASVARYQLALSQIALGALDEAEATLRENLRDAALEADPAIAQDSRLALAGLLRDLSRDGEAVVRLQELLARDAADDTRFQAQLMLADCLRRSARPAAGRVEEMQSESAKMHYRRRKQEDLEQAVGLLTGLEHELAAREQAQRLSVPQEEILHQCRWAMAECCYELDRNEDALTLYEQLAETYNKPSDWLRAQFQIVNCQFRLNRLEEARTVLRLAQQRLAQLPSDEAERIGMSEQRWQELLNDGIQR